MSKPECRGDEWKDVERDPVHGRDEVPKSFKRLGTVVGVETSPDAAEWIRPIPKSDIRRIGIGSKENTNSFVTSDTWMYAEEME
jgi:hypothetical protein